MAIMELGDIPSGSLAGAVISHASVASDGANATYGGAAVATKWRAPQACTIVGAYWEPHGANSAAANASSYRDLKLINGGADATGTTVLASLSLTASLASNTQRAFTLVSNSSLSTPVLAAGDVVYASQNTVGGAHSAGTVLVAGQFRFNYRPI